MVREKITCSGGCDFLIKMWTDITIEKKNQLLEKEIIQQTINFLINHKRVFENTVHQHVSVCVKL